MIQLAFPYPPLIVRQDSSPLRYPTFYITSWFMVRPSFFPVFISHDAMIHLLLPNHPVLYNIMIHLPSLIHVYILDHDSSVLFLMQLFILNHDSSFFPSLSPFLYYMLIHLLSLIPILYCVITDLDLFLLSPFLYYMVIYLLSLFILRPG